jgi:hypothetical protein
MWHFLGQLHMQCGQLPVMRGRMPLPACTEAAACCLFSPCWAAVQRPLRHTILLCGVGSMAACGDRCRLAGRVPRTSNIILGPGTTVSECPAWLPLPVPTAQLPAGCACAQVAACWQGHCMQYTLPARHSLSP